MLEYIYSLAISGLIDTSVFSVLGLLVVPSITIYYMICNKQKNLLFFLFLICYSIADLLHVVDLNANSDSLYFICNSLYVLAYFILLFHIIISLDFRIILKKFLIQSIVLLGLMIALFIVLHDIIDPIMFETDFLDEVRFIEHLYNIVLLALLAVSFLNYLEKDTRRSLILFIGCLAISNSEFILIGYYYLSDLELLNYIASVLNILAFVLFYVQSNVDPEPQNNSKALA